MFGKKNQEGKSPNEELPKTQEEQIKDAVDSAPQAENGYVPPTSAAELSYAKELAARIAKSGFAKVKVAHKDFVLMNADGCINFDEKTLKGTDQQLVIDDNPDCATGTYWEIKD